MLARRAFAPYLGPLCRANLSASDASLARHANSGPSPKSRGVQQPQPGNSVAVSNTTSDQVGQTAEQWAEVVDKPSGQVYYWNQQTGETTALGEPKPGPLGRIQNRVVPLQSSGSGSSLLGMVAAGAGIGLVFSVIGRIL